MNHPIEHADGNPDRAVFAFVAAGGWISQNEYAGLVLKGPCDPLHTHLETLSGLSDGYNLWSSRRGSRIALPHLRLFDFKIH